jgi:acetyl-CoA/propionyl-CoA carboxylase biotin carboxyl carrier protein
MEMRGHAIECRINAEAAHKKFAPAPGKVGHYLEPSGPGVRVDSGVAGGSGVAPRYDPMGAKLIVRGADRDDAIGRMLRALGEYRIGGVKTLIGFHQALLSHPCFRAGKTCHGVVESPEIAARAEELSVDEPGPVAPLAAATVERVTFGEVEGRRVEVKVHVPEPPYRELARRRRQRAAHGGAGATGAIVSPMQGTVLDVKVAEGDAVEPGQVICVIEAMTMENEVTAVVAGTVASLAVSPLQPITIGQPIATIDPAG